MRKFLLCGTSAIAISLASAGGAAAADAVPSYVAPAPLAYDWSGWYIGGHMGGFDASAHFNSSPFSVTETPFDQSGWVGGFQSGYNWQHNSVVFGFEGDLSAVGGGHFGDDGYAAFDVEVTSTIRGRLGFAFDHILVYGTAGGAYLGGTYGGSTAPGSGDLDEWVGVWGGGVEIAHPIHGKDLRFRIEVLDYDGTGPTAASGDDIGSIDDFTVYRFGVNMPL